jgi:pimeloyl-ACP methyl ester carboxylesterase
MIFKLKNRNEIMAKTSLMRGFGCRTILLAAAAVFIAGCATTPPCGQTRCVQSFDGETITYNVYGGGDVTLVFVHGWSCDSRYWREQVPVFARKYRVVTMDLAGHGNSSMGRKIYSVESFAQDVKAVIEAVDANKVIVIGHSFGGEIVATAARQEAKKVIGIIGVDTLQNVEEWYSREEAGKLIGLDGFKKDFKASVKTFVEQMMVKGMNPELKQWIIDDMSSAPANIGISALEEYTGTIADKKMISVFKEVKAPVRCVNTDLWPTNIEANRRYMSSFDVAIMKGVGHLPMLERPDEFNKLLNRSIQEITRK